MNSCNNDWGTVGYILPITAVWSPLSWKAVFERRSSQDLGAEVIVPKGDTSGSEKAGIFNRSEFKYDPDKDIYICPAGEELQNRMRVFEGGKELDGYFNNIACRDCKIRSKCTTSKRDPWKIKRWIHESLTETMLKKLEEQPELMLHRKQTVENPFGTIKLWMDATHLLTRRR